MAFVTSPCNSWSLMRSLPGRIPVSPDERHCTNDVALTTVKTLKYLQKRLEEFIPSGRLLVVWENPSSAGKASLGAYLESSGILDDLGLVRHQTSWCQYGLQWSKPSDVMTNIPGFMPLPPCLNYSEFGRCSKWRDHLHVKALPTSESYKFPEVLAAELAHRAYIDIMEQNSKAGVVRSEGNLPKLRFPGRHQRFPTPEAFTYPRKTEPTRRPKSIYKRVSDGGHRRTGRPSVRFSPRISFYENEHMRSIAHAVLNEDVHPAISHTKFPSVGEANF